MAVDGLLLDLAVARFLSEEGRMIDDRRWAEWLALFDESSVFWMPARGPGGLPYPDPEDGINLLYLNGRAALENRVFRVQDGDSVANTPLPHTCHLVGSVIADALGDGTIRATASWSVVATNPARGLQQRSGHYEYLLRREGEGFRILRKKVLPIDEVFDGFIDVYLV